MKQEFTVGSGCITSAARPLCCKSALPCNTRQPQDVHTQISPHVQGAVPFSNRGLACRGEGEGEVLGFARKTGQECHLLAESTSLVLYSF